MRNAQHEMQRMTSQWYSEIRESPDTSDIEVDFQQPTTNTSGVNGTNGSTTATLKTVNTSNF